MTSAINPNNINGAYPVAGQDNDSQGFRDNFTNTKTNFQYASAEITDLQNKAILKSALTGGVLNNNMNGSLLTNAQFTNITVPKEALGTVTTAAIDYSVSSYYTLTTGGNVTLSFSNLPGAGELATWRVQITVTNTGYTVTLPSSVSVGTSNLQGYVNNVITFSKTGTYEFEFETSDGGTTVSIFDLNRNRDPIYLPSYEDLADGAAADLTVTTSLFSTDAAETATLADGYEGQVKVLAATDVSAGDMVITVASYGWAGGGNLGTITFNDFGQSCTLLFINGAWYCIGNNGAVFG